MAADLAISQILRGSDSASCSPIQQPDDSQEDRRRQHLGKTAAAAQASFLTPQPERPTASFGGRGAICPVVRSVSYSAHSRLRRRATRSAVGGWDLNRPAKLTL